MKEISHFEVALGVLGGLAIFLYGLDILSSALHKFSKEKMEKFLLKFSQTTWRGIFSGTIATTILDSSSVVIIFLIAFIDNGLINFSNSIGIVLGANIGNAFSSQIIAFNFGKYAAIPLVIGIFGNLISKKEKTKNYFRLISGFSFIFYGLHLMDVAALPYRDSPEVINWMTSLQNPFYGAFVGMVITLIIQSSSATVGIAIILTSQGLLSLEGGVAVMIGSEVGTCFDTLIASIGRKKEAIKLGLFHLSFNLISVALGLFFFTYFNQAVEMFSPDNSSIERKLANSHLLFNLIGVFLCFSFLVLWQKLQKLRR